MSMDDFTSKGSSLLGNRRWLEAESPDGMHWKIVVALRGNPLRLADSFGTMPLRSAIIALGLDVLLLPFALLPGRRVGVIQSHQETHLTEGRLRYLEVVPTARDADHLAIELCRELSQGKFRWDPVRSGMTPDEQADAKRKRLDEAARADTFNERLARAILFLVVLAIGIATTVLGAGGDRVLWLAPLVFATALGVDAIRSVALGRPRRSLMKWQDQAVCAGLGILIGLFLIVM